MTAAIELDPYLYQGVDREWDYYLVFGNYRHGVRGNPRNPATNWVSVGYYASRMTLGIRCVTPHAKLVDFGPGGTIAQVTESYTVGGSLSGGFKGWEPTGSATLNAGFGVSFSTPEVTFSVSSDLTSVDWDVHLPCVGWQSPGRPPNPATASYNGYLWRPSAIFRVKKGDQFKAQITGEVDWDFDWTRGITYDQQQARFDQTFEYTGVSTEAGESREEPLYPIVETLQRRPAEFATLVQALEFLDIARYFDNGITENTLIAPTNEAFSQGLWGPSGAAERLLGPGTEDALNEYLRSLILVGDVTKHAGSGRQVVRDVGGREVEVALRDGVLQCGDVPLAVRFTVPCTDGVIIGVDAMPERSLVPAASRNGSALAAR